MPHGLRASRHMYIYSVPAVCLRFLIRARGIALLVPVSLLVPVPKRAALPPVLDPSQYLSIHLLRKAPLCRLSPSSVSPISEIQIHISSQGS
ncbi:hypothetical protein TgHK011_000775 [Trichoderma gracile]|nr:hypothetical protein TgHK011_000775 [Trichoderma gracile]